MHIILIIKNYRKKAVYLCLAIIPAIASFIAVNLLLHSFMIFKVTINNYMTFSYPFNFRIENVYFNEELAVGTIETTSFFKRPSPTEFTDYNSIKGKFKFSYPSLFEINPKFFNGIDILYHIDFYDKQNIAHGFVEVWNMPYSLKNFLENSKKASIQNFKYFNSEEIEVNGNPGYLWDYSVLGSDGVYYKAMELFWKVDSRMYRISYFVRESSWDKSQADIFWKIVNSFKTY